MGLTEIIRGLGRYLIHSSLPAIPASKSKTLDALRRLLQRDKQIEQAKQGCTTPLALGGHPAKPAYDYLFGRSGGRLEEARADFERRLKADDDDARSLIRNLISGEQEPISRPSRDNPNLPLEKPEQFSAGWTHFPDVAGEAQSRLADFTASLEDAGRATDLFWPTLTQYGLPYNLLILNKLAVDDVDALAAFGRSDDLAGLARAGRLYAIDMTVLECVETTEVEGSVRFVPTTVTLLEQDADTLELRPIAVQVENPKTRITKVFWSDGARSGAWLYALQAAKTSITVWGVWLGHVYSWHIVTAAMQEAMSETLSGDHPVRQLLGPQSKHLIGFDGVLLLLWDRVAPPTPVSSAREFLELANDYAQGREFFDDDPREILKANGIEAADFTSPGGVAWDRYPLVGKLLGVWEICARYVDTFVNETYADDDEVRDDRQLQKWMEKASERNGGNVDGLPQLDSRAALVELLTSLVYRVTVHGAGRLPESSSPGLTFVANFPPCLQTDAIPDPSDDLSTAELLKVLPHTTTIGDMLNFYFTFAFSTPYEPLIPLEGVEERLFFGTDPSEPRNRALIEFRSEIADWIRQEGGSELLFQWPMSIET